MAEQEPNGPTSESPQTSSPAAANDMFRDLVVAAGKTTTANGLAKKEEEDLEGPARVRKEVHAIAVRAVRWGAWILVAVIIVRVWHLIGLYEVCGIKMRWLTNDDLQSIDKMLFSSAFGGLVLSYLRSVMYPKDPQQ